MSLFLNSIRFVMVKKSDIMGLKSGTPFFFMSRLVKILKIFKEIIKNWNGITCNCRVFFFCSLFYVDIQCSSEN